MEPSLEVYETLPIVPLRDVVVFPHMMMPFVIGRPSSTRALEHALLKDKRIFLAAKHADTIAAHLVVGVDEKQNLLEIISPIERLNRIAGILEIEVDKLQVDRRIQSRVKKQMEKAQKEYYLNEKMKAIQKELGRKDEKGNEVDELK